METIDLAILAGLNFASVFMALFLLKWSERRRRFNVGKAILEDMGKKAEMDMNFAKIIQQNFGPEIRQNGDEE